MMPGVYEDSGDQLYQFPDEPEDEALGFWAAVVPLIASVAGGVLQGKAQKSAQKAQMDHEMKMAKLQADLESKKAALLARAQSSPGGGGGGMSWLLPVGIVGVAALGAGFILTRGAGRRPADARS